MATAPITIDLSAAIVSIQNNTPMILTVDQKSGREGLPYGPFDPVKYRTMELALRSFVAEQAGLQIAYAEQLYTFGDRGRHATIGDTEPHVVSAGYLALTQVDHADRDDSAPWRSWYDYFPWEDWRAGRPPVLDQAILPRLRAWAKGSTSRRFQTERINFAFGESERGWVEENVLDRYELVYEAGLVAEAYFDGREGTRDLGKSFLGRAMNHDHRRIVATAIQRLRGKLKYRPVVFELMNDTFTLTALQRTVEALTGTHLHKQNFRRLVEASALVESTGSVSENTGGRPARLYRFIRDGLEQQIVSGLRVGSR